MSAPIILKNDLFNRILLDPSKSFDELCIVSGFATPAMVMHHLEAIKTVFDKKDLRVNLTIGMTSSDFGISAPHHKNFVKLSNENDLFKCSYIRPNCVPTHSKIYVWLRQGQPELAFLASANYTLNAFKRNQDEVATLCNPSDAYVYYKSKVPMSFYCTCEEANDLVKGLPDFIHENKEGERVMKEGNSETVELPLFSEKNGTMHIHSGLNWGQREKRAPNQAYIPIPSKIAKSGFFPPRGQQFSVLTDDGFPFVCVVAQDGDKAIHSTNNNSELGEYFRNKLGVKLGDRVTLDDLDRYGNRYVKFTKINEEEYYMEFEPSASKI